MRDLDGYEQFHTETKEYRDGIARTFRKYDGQPTDETDSRGRPKRVTLRRFARHVGVDPITLELWVAESIQRDVDLVEDLMSDPKLRRARLRAFAAERKRRRQEKGMEA